EINVDGVPDDAFRAGAIKKDRNHLLTAYSRTFMTNGKPFGQFRLVKFSPMFDHVWIRPPLGKTDIGERRPITIKLKKHNEASPKADLNMYRNKIIQQWQIMTGASGTEKSFEAHSLKNSGHCQS
ncbi:hypothetical protein Tcan_00732, partial [Toxocara canis]